jgi:predicted metal-dependent hydrolase
MAVAEDLPLLGGHTRVEWRRSARARRVSLRIDPRRGAVVVTLPMRAARRAGMALLMTHADWVAARLAALPGAVPFAPGAQVLLDGVAHTLRHAPERRGTVWVEAGEILVAGEAAFLPRRVGDFLRAEARARLTRLVQEKGALAGLVARRVVVKDTRSRWGSCASSRTLAFSWRLVMAPPFVQDYVTAHEVAHLQHMNHGGLFWALVERLTPHRLAAVEWLRVQGPGLLRVG